MVDAAEKRAVAILDIANPFLHAKREEMIPILLRGILADGAGRSSYVLQVRDILAKWTGHAIRTIEQGSLRYA